MHLFAFELNECDLESDLGKRLGLASTFILDIFKTLPVYCAFFRVHKGEVCKNK